MQKITFNYNDITLDVIFSLEENTVWMSQDEMAILFGVTRNKITKLISTIKMENKVDFSSVCSKFAHTGTDGKTYNINHYNLDIIKEVGYKINPSLTEYFINWCKEELNRLNHQLLLTQSNIIRFNEDNLSLDVKVLPEEETVYLDQDGLGTLFDTTKPNISMHIKNIYDSGELDERATVKDFLIVQMEGDREVVSN